MRRPVVLVTGTRYPLKTTGALMVGHIVFGLNPYHVIIGDCETGVDATMFDILTSPKYMGKVGFDRCIADWSELGKSAGPRRNAEMVSIAKRYQRDGDIVIAVGFPFGEARGTRHCLGLAKVAGLYVGEFDISAHVRVEKEGRG